jgi:hypothetical protein
MGLGACFVGVDDEIGVSYNAKLNYIFRCILMPKAFAELASPPTKP